MTNPIAREPDEAMALRVLAQRERDLGFTAYADWLDAGCPASFEWPYPQEKLDEILFYARAMEATKHRETASPASEAFIDAVQSAQTKLDDLRASLNGDPFGGSRLSIFATDLEALLSAACRAPTAASPTPRDTLVEIDAWNPRNEDPFWMLEAEDGEWLKNEHTMTGTRDPAKAMRFPTERDCLKHPAKMNAGYKWWGAKATEHLWINHAALNSTQQPTRENREASHD
jgi:hypothetical protein